MSTIGAVVDKSHNTATSYNINEKLANEIQI